MGDSSQGAALHNKIPINRTCAHWLREHTQSRHAADTRNQGLRTEPAFGTASWLLLFNPLA